MTKLIATRGLDLRVKLWVEAMKQAAIGPLLIATEVVDVVDNYHLFVEQTGEENPNAWLTCIFRPGLGPAFWRRRAHAVTVLDVRGDKSVARTLHHEAAVWLVNNASEASYPAILNAAFVFAGQQGGAPVSRGQLMRIVEEVTGKPASGARPCKECERLRALLDKNGVDAESAP